MRKFVKIKKYLNENKRITNTKILLSKKTKIEIITQKIITKTQRKKTKNKVKTPMEMKIARSKAKIMEKYPNKKMIILRVSYLKI